MTRWSSIAAAILLFTTVGTTSLVSASSNSNPDENLYPVKRTYENMRLRFTFDQERKNIHRYRFPGGRSPQKNLGNSKKFYEFLNKS